MGDITHPIEILLLVFCHLPYFALQKATCVCHRWRCAILNDVLLCQRLFKTKSPCYLEEHGQLESYSHHQDGSIRLHPALFNIRYRMGDEQSQLRLQKTPTYLFQSFDLAIGRDFMCIPSIDHAQVTISSRPAGRSAITFTVTNHDGLRVSDILSAIIVETRKTCDLLSFLTGGMFSQRLHFGQTPLLQKKAAVLGDPSFFHSFGRIERKGERSASIMILTDRWPPTKFTV